MRRLYNVILPVPGVRQRPVLQPLLDQHPGHPDTVTHESQTENQHHRRPPCNRRTGRCDERWGDKLELPLYGPKGGVRKGGETD